MDTMDDLGNHTFPMERRARCSLNQQCQPQDSTENSAMATFEITSSSWLYWFPHFLGQTRYHCVLYTIQITSPIYPHFRISFGPPDSSHPVTG